MSNLAVTLLLPSLSQLAREPRAPFHVAFTAITAAACMMFLAPRWERLDTVGALRHLPVFCLPGPFTGKKKGTRSLTYKKTDCIFGISMVELVKISRADFQ